ncbi:MAG: R.Pab1 family restriction endonuclease [Candidatus Nomurabacteria bacterium]|jgi:hypothetical protein|nr:R.Pab1 family restriction endonuclease [Candidatus Nomurabacteria bacterium]
MPQILINPEEHEISVPIAITATKSKIQIKNRSHSNEYGIPVAATRDGFTLESYIEWMIGYDVKWGKTDRSGIDRKTTNAKELEKLNNSTLQDVRFIGANGFIKALYELSEYIYYFYNWGDISREDLENVKNYLNGIASGNLIDGNSGLQIDRSHPVPRIINDFGFEYTQVKYPLLIYKFADEFSILTEVKITEKQYAVGTQPMLYLCFPITKLRSAGEPLVGRVASSNEVAYFDITAQNISVFLEVLKMFGILSDAHKHDVLRIIEMILA